jgi:hypothetical protein
MYLSLTGADFRQRRQRITDASTFIADAINGAVSRF